MQYVDESDKKPSSKMTPPQCKRVPGIKLEESESSDSESEDEEEVVADQVPSFVEIVVHHPPAPVRFSFKRTIDEQLKEYANGELVVDDPVVRRALDALLDDSSDDETIPL